jgi:hypothetical protein
LDSIKQWNFPDPAPNIPICQIPRYADRAIALMARNRDKPLLNTGFLRIYGAVEMVAGMEYHYDNFVRLNCEIREICAVRFCKASHSTAQHLPLDGVSTQVYRTSVN